MQLELESSWSSFPSLPRQVLVAGRGTPRVSQPTGADWGVSSDLEEGFVLTEPWVPLPA